MSWHFVHSLWPSGLRVRMSAALSLWHCMQPLRSAFHVCGTWQLAQLLCFSAVVFSGPIAVRPFAFFSWQSTHVWSAVSRGACDLWHPTHFLCSSGPFRSSPMVWKFSNWWQFAQTGCPSCIGSFLPCALWQSWQATPPCSACSFTSRIGRTSPVPDDASSSLSPLWHVSHACVVGGRAFFAEAANE